MGFRNGSLRVNIQRYLNSLFSNSVQSNVQLTFLWETPINVYFSDESLPLFYGAMVFNCWM